MSVEPNEIHVRRRQKIQEDKDFTSARISESARYIGFGLAAATMAFLSSDASFPHKMSTRFGPFLLLAAALGCLTIVLDYLQYLFAYKSSEDAGRNKDGGYLYLNQSSYYRARRWFFAGKQLSAFFGAAVFIVVLLSAMAG
jgi:hypothetical protein